MKVKRYSLWFIRCCLLGVLCFAVLLFTSRWWLPVALPKVLARFDVQAEAVSVAADGGLRAAQVKYVSDGVLVQVDDVVLPSWSVYAWERYFGDGVSGLDASAARVTVRVSESTDTPTEPSNPMSPLAVFQLVNQIFTTYGEWLPAVEVGEVEVFVYAASVCAMHGLSVDGGQVSASVETDYWPQTVVARGDLSDAAQWDLTLNVTSFGLQSQSHLQANGESLEVTSVISHGQNVLKLTGAWAGPWMPQRLSLDSQAFEVSTLWFPELKAMDAERLQLTDVNALWENGSYRASLQVGTDVAMASKEAMPLNAKLSLSGDFSSLRVETLQVHADWGQVALSDPFEIDLKRGGVSARAQLTAAVDFSKQSYFPASGVLQGKVQVMPDAAQELDVTFDLTGADLGYEHYHVAGLHVAGSMLGSKVRLDQLELDLLGDTPEERVALSGEADWKARTLDVHYTAAMGADWMNAQLEAEYFTDELNCAGRVWGSWDTPQLQGKLEPVTVNHPYFKPFELAGQLSSISGGVYELQGSAKCDGATTEIDLAAQRSDEVCTVEIKRFEMSDPGLPQLSLLAPATVRYRTGGELLQRLEVEPVHLSSDNGQSLQIDWGAGDGFLFSITQMNSERISHWLKQPLLKFDIDALELRLSHLEPHVLGSVKVHAAFEVESKSLLRLDLEGDLQSEAMQIDQLGLQFEQESLLAGQITLPLRLQVPKDGAQALEVVTGGAVSGSMKGQTTPAFTEWVSQQFGVGVSDVALDLEVAGSLEDPSGLLNLQVETLDLGDRFTKDQLPVLNKLMLQAHLDGAEWKLNQLELLVHESKLQVSGGVPTDDVLRALTNRDMKGWEALSTKAYGRVDLVGWKFEQWIHLFPGIFRQSGELNGFVELKTGLDLTGKLSFDDFGLRPTSSFSIIDQIGGELILEGRKLTLQQASVRIGSSPVAFTGWIDGSDLANPLWELKAEGANVPLVRTTDLILRSDVDLTFDRLHAEDVPKVSGELNFTPSTLLVEFDPFAPSVKSGRSIKPPYFSITTPSIADWKFDLVGKGNAFLRVRSPYCRALVSANLSLEGSFKQPLLLGDLRVASGDVLFPSVKMTLDSGMASIERTRPNEVQLDFSGITQVSSYVITMDVSQTVGDPSISFSSTPDLPNSQIIQLLATGSSSGGGVGAVGIYLGKGLLGIGAGGVDSSIADRLTIEVGEAGGRDGNNTFGVEYRLTDDLSVNGGYDIHEAYNLDLLWSIFKR